MATNFPVSRLKKIFGLLFLLALVFCSYLFFSQQDVPTDIAHSDKYGHIIVFFGLSLLLYNSAAISRWAQMAILTSYGVAVEVIQSYIPYRSGGIDDVIADVIGILLFYVGAYLVQHKLGGNKFGGKKLRGTNKHD